MIRTRLALVILPVFFFTACASKSVGTFAAHVPSSAGTAEANLVFPYGRYTHDVKLTVQNGKRDFSFQGIIETKPDRILLTALSPFQTTLMRVAEDRRTGEIQLDCYVEELKHYQNHFSDYYQLVRQVLIMERSRDDEKGKRHFTLASDERNAEGWLSEYDNKIPRRIEITDPRFLLKIKVTDVPAEDRK